MGKKTSESAFTTIPPKHNSSSIVFSALVKKAKHSSKEVRKINITKLVN